jgi:hypothetical protein
MTKEERKLYMQEYRKTEKWKSSKIKSDKKYYQSNKESITFNNKIWKENNLEKFYQINKEWAINNPEKIKEAQIKYRKNNPSYKIRNLFHNLKRRFQNGHGKEDHKVIKDYIESLFIEDMNWGNIEIDHKIPITWFKSLTPLIYINDLRNLQPLFIKHNRNKAATYCHPIEKGYYNLIETYIKPTRIKQILETISL